MQLQKLGNIKEKTKTLKALGVHGGGIDIISKKMELMLFCIKDLRTPAVNILKQDALSIGAELAVPSGVILCQKEHYDCILMGTRKHIEILSRKELSQSFGLKDVAKELSRFLDIKPKDTKIMGIINANDDSFFEGSRFTSYHALREIENMIDNGADIIDIGAVSSRPNAEEVSCDEELRRIKDICDTIYKQELYTKTIFSIDSYIPSVVEYALKSGFGIINDITGGENDEVIKLAIKYSAKLVIMHKQGTPQTMQDNPRYDDIISEINHFFEIRIKKCEELGLSREDIILDVGIGFGKTLEHNITLIKNLSNFEKFDCEVLIGASRKSMIDALSPSSVANRLSGTLAIHLRALENGANIIRCHDVYEHKQAIDVYEALR
ncbi:MAG: dihydropteroate synthase [Sulfurovum sp.]